MLSNHRRTLVLSLLAVPGIALLQGCGDDGTNLWGYIDTQPDLKTLAAAIRAAGLVDAVAASPRTLFAPTDAAFEALLAELGTTLDALVADTALLTKVLTYHVVPARALKADIVPGQPITSLQGQSLIIDASLKITDANQRVSTIVATDTLASNGVIHLIDRVLLPT